jgi:hypothetical protein
MRLKRVQNSLAVLHNLSQNIVGTYATLRTSTGREGPHFFSIQHWTQRSLTPALNTFLPYKVTNRLTHGAASSFTEYSLILHITILATRWAFAMLHTGTGINECTIERTSKQESKKASKQESKKANKKQECN